MVRVLSAFCVTLVLVAATVPAASTGGCEREGVGSDAACCAGKCCDKPEGAGDQGRESGEGSPACSDQACCFHAATCIAPALVRPATATDEVAAVLAPLPVPPSAPSGDILHVPRLAA